MAYFAKDKDTICAVATAPGVGGISVIRLSGVDASQMIGSLFTAWPDQPESHKIYYGFIKDKASGEAIDEVLCSYFAKGQSFTGDSTVEISCHGGQQVSQQILQQLCSCGARIAERGEFSYRAFINGNIDLVQAESILSLIESQSKAAARQSLRQLKGELSAEISTIEKLTTKILAHLEANIDFASEDIVVKTNEQLIIELDEVMQKISHLVKSYSSGRLINEGLQVSLVGRPNVGKSSLLNCLVQEDKAIVTDEPGTTRDLVEAQINIEGHRVIFVDTAGLRQTTHQVEKIGIEKSIQASVESDVVFFVYDLSEGFTQMDVEEFSRIDCVAKNIFFIGNKLDKVQVEVEDIKNQITKRLPKLTGLSDEHFLTVSAKQNLSIELILQNLKRLNQSYFNEDGAVVLQARHFHLLQQSLQNILRAKEQLSQEASPEFVIIDLQEALMNLMQITGKKFDDEVMDAVFKEFCLGK